jgi:adenosylcobinamide-GDP ribazoletransferase
VKRFLAAIRFLTILPVPGTWGAEEGSLAGSVIFFPVVGLLLGVVAAAAAWGLSLVAPPMVAAAVLVVLMLAFSGGLHMDGLSDTADGFLSHRPREQVLEIMKDSHVGAMGVMAIVCVLLLKFAALSSIAASPWSLWVAAFMIPLAGRCAMVLPMALLDYVRPTGLASVFHRRGLVLAAIVAMATLFVAATGSGLACGAMLATFQLSYIAKACGLWVAAKLTATATIIAAAGAVSGVNLLALWSRKKIGGATGDVYGAACEVAELVTAVTLAVLLRWCEVV